MQDAKVLSKKDIIRLNRAIERLVAIGQRLLGDTVADDGEDGEAKPKRRKRRRRSRLVETPSVTPNGGVVLVEAEDN